MQLQPGSQQGQVKWTRRWFRRASPRNRGGHDWNVAAPVTAREP